MLSDASLYSYVNLRVSWLVNNLNYGIFLDDLYSSPDYLRSHTTTFTNFVSDDLSHKYTSTYNYGGKVDWNAICADNNLLLTNETNVFEYTFYLGWLEDS